MLPTAISVCMNVNSVVLSGPFVLFGILYCGYVLFYYYSHHVGGTGSCTEACASVFWSLLMIQSLELALLLWRLANIVRKQGRYSSGYGTTIPMY